MKKASFLVLLFVLMVAAASEAAIITTEFDAVPCDDINCFANENGTFSTGQTGSAFIIRFSLGGAVLVNTDVFPSITGGEFSFAPTLDNEIGAGTWTYTPGPGDPVIRFWAAESGGRHNFFYSNGADGIGGAESVTTGPWSTPNGKQLQELSFFDTTPGPRPDPDPVPEPASLLLAGVVTALGVRRLRR